MPWDNCTSSNYSCLNYSAIKQVCSCRTLPGNEMFPLSFLPFWHITTFYKLINELDIGSETPHNVNRLGSMYTYLYTCLSLGLDLVLMNRLQKKGVVIWFQFGYNAETTMWVNHAENRIQAIWWTCTFFAHVANQLLQECLGIFALRVTPTGPNNRCYYPIATCQEMTWSSIGLQ